jgi:hypothetical protein
MAQPRERLFRDDAGAALERITRLEEENRRLRAELERRDAPAVKRLTPRLLGVLGGISLLLVATGVCAAVVASGNDGKPLEATASHTARRVQVRAETTSAAWAVGLGEPAAPSTHRDPGSFP